MGALVVVGFVYAALRGNPHVLILPGPAGAAKEAMLVAMPYSLAASVILLTGWVVGIFYCLDALYGERRDHSILFWKSMPVSDTTTVFAKATIPIVVLPLVATAVALATQLAMLAISAAIRLASGLEPRGPDMAQMALVMLYGEIVHALWFAPIFGWLLLVSAWARQAVLLWAVLPFFAAYVFEMLATGKSFVAYVLRYRFLGAMQEAFTRDALKTPVTTLSQFEPANFLSSPGLWLGLAFAAACVVAAIRLRRYRDPI